MKNDTFICLGDVGSPGYIKDIKERKKILILGNHDAKGAYKNYFDEIYTGLVFIAEKILLKLFLFGNIINVSMLRIIDDVI
jgi:calcineurin-like phosphoesterase family protein